MRTLRNIRSDSLEFEQSSSGAAVLIIPLALTLLVLAWWFEPQSTWGRGLVSAVALACLSALLWAAQSQLSERARPTSSAGRLNPVAEAAGDGANYRVRLEAPGRSELLLEHGDPAVVLTDLRRIAEATQLPVTPAWGLSSERFSTAAPSTTLELLPAHVVGPHSSNQTAVVQSLFGAAAFVLVVFIWSVVTEQPELTALSVALPLITVALLVAIGSYLATLRVHVNVDANELHVQEVTWLGRRERCRVSVKDLLALDVVGHLDRPPTHVLLETRSGLQSFRLAGASALELAHELRRGSQLPASRRAGASHAPEAAPSRLASRPDEAGEFRSKDPGAAAPAGLDEASGSARGLRHAVGTRPRHS